MGMIFNNWWEAFCRTYLELNGYFVQNNLFTDLHDLGESHPHEADIVAYKIPGTRIKFALDDPPDRRPGDEHVFWAGSEEAAFSGKCLGADVSTVLVPGSPVTGGA